MHLLHAIWRHSLVGHSLSYELTLHRIRNMATAVDSRSPMQPGHAAGMTAQTMEHGPCAPALCGLTFTATASHRLVPPCVGRRACMYPLPNSTPVPDPTYRYTSGDVHALTSKPDSRGLRMEENKHSKRFQGWHRWPRTLGEVLPHHHTAGPHPCNCTVALLTDAWAYRAADCVGAASALMPGARTVLRPPARAQSTRTSSGSCGGAPAPAPAPVSREHRLLHRGRLGEGLDVKGGVGELA